MPFPEHYYGRMHFEISCCIYSRARRDLIDRYLINDGSRIRSILIVIAGIVISD